MQKIVQSGVMLRKYLLILSPVVVVALVAALIVIYLSDIPEQSGVSLSSPVQADEHEQLVYTVDRVVPESIAKRGTLLPEEMWFTGFAVDSEDRLAFLTGSYGSSIHFYNNDGTHSIPSLSKFFDGSGLHTDSYGIYATNSAFCSLDVLDYNGLLRWYQSISCSPNWVIGDGLGHVYINDFDTTDILVFDSAGTALNSWDPGEYYSAPEIGGGFLWFADGASGIGKVDLTGTTSSGGSGTFIGNIGLANEIPVYNETNGEVYGVNGTSVRRYDVAGALQGSFTINAADQYDFDSAGQFYSMNFTTRVVEVYSSTGSYLYDWSTYASADVDSLTSPTGFYRDDNGNYYVSDTFKNRIVLYDSDLNFDSVALDYSAENSHFYQDIVYFEGHYYTYAPDGGFQKYDSAGNRLIGNDDMVLYGDHSTDRVSMDVYNGSLYSGGGRYNQTGTLTATNSTCGGYYVSINSAGFIYSSRARSLGNGAGTNSRLTKCNSNLGGATVVNLDFDPAAIAHDINDNTYLMGTDNIIRVYDNTDTLIHEISITGLDVSPFVDFTDMAVEEDHDIVLLDHAGSRLVRIDTLIDLDEVESSGVTQLTFDTNSDTIDFTLSSYPFSDVTVMITSSHPDIQLLPNTVVFTPENWNTPQTVSLSFDGTFPIEDIVESLSFSIISGDVAFAALTPEDLTVYISGHEPEEPPVDPPVEPPTEPPVEPPVPPVVPPTEDEEPAEEEEEVDEPPVIPPDEEPPVVPDPDVPAEGGSFFAAFNQRVLATVEAAGEVVVEVAEVWDEENYGAITAGTVTVVSFAYLLFFLNELPALIMRTWFGILSLLGLRDAHSFGVVYDSLDKAPVNNAVVRAYSVLNRSLVSTDVTQYNGVFNMRLPEGEYTLDVQKAGYRFPSQSIKSPSDGVYQNIYTGERFVQGKQILVDRALPIDRDNAEVINLLGALARNGLVNGFFLFLRVLLIVGFALSIVVLLYDPTPLNLGIVLIYLIPFALSASQRLLHRTYSWGVITDESGNPMQGVVVTLVEEGSERTIQRSETDNEGRYRFVVNPGLYKLDLRGLYRVSKGRTQFKFKRKFNTIASNLVLSRESAPSM